MSYTHLRPACPRTDIELRFYTAKEKKQYGPGEVLFGSTGTRLAIDGTQEATMPRSTLIAEFRDGPYVGQRREMGYRQLFWRPEGETGIYVRTGKVRPGGEEHNDKLHFIEIEFTPDRSAIVWFWHQDKPREGT
jgi:hypothetical protein